jgi:hypothetical protein
MKPIHPESPSYVLVEEESRIRSRWQQIASEKGLDLVVYENPEKFLADFAHNHFSRRHRFFLDQDFGERRGVGVQIARIIKARMPSYVCIVTAYPKDLFCLELSIGVIDDVADKFPEPFECRREPRISIGTMADRGEVCLA